MSTDWGELPLGTVIPFIFTSHDGATGANEAMSGLALADIEVYKGVSLTQRASDAGYAFFGGDADGIDLDTFTGVNGVSIDTGDNTDAGFFVAGSLYTVVLGPITIDVQTVYTVLGTFRLVAAESVAGVKEVDVTHVNGAAQTATLDTLKTDTAAILVDTGTTLDARIPAALVGGRIDASVGAMAANVMTAAAAAADLTTELQAGLATAAALTVIDDFLDTEIATLVGYGAPPTAAVIADAVWDEAQADHVAVGSFGIVASEVADVLVDTAEIGAAGAGLTAINLPDQTMAITGNITGNLSGSVGSVTGAVGSVTGAVGSVTAGVTVTTNNDKTGYALSAAAIQAIWDALTSALVTVGSVGKLLVDNINATIGSRSSHAAADVWAVATRLLTAGTNIVLAKGVGVTGFNDLSAAQVNAEVDTALADYNGPTHAEMTAELATADDAVLAVLGAAGAGLTAVPWNAAWDAEVQSEAADALVAYDGPTHAELTAELATADDATLAAIAALWTTALTESYNADGAAPTPAQALFVIMQMLTEMSIAGTTMTVKKLDGATTAFTLTLDAATPTSVTRAT